MAKAGGISAAKRFPKRREGADTSGQDYEWKIAALLFLRGINSKEMFYLASNMKEAGKFDDIVFIHESHKKTVAYFIQVKHKQNPDHAISNSALTDPNGKFSLPSYCQSLSQVEQLLPKLSNKLHVHIHEFALVLFTNAKVAGTSGEADSILNTGGQLITFGTDSEIFTSYEQLMNYKELLESTIITGGEDKESNAEKVREWKDLLQKNKYSYKLNKLTNCSDMASQLQELREEVKNLHSMPHFQNFLHKVKIFNRQKSEKDLDSLIQQEFNQACNITGDSYIIQLDNFKRKVKYWWTSKNFFLSESSPLWKETIISVLSENKLRELSNLGLIFEEQALNSLQTAITSNEVVIVISECTDTCVDTLKVHQAIRSERHILVGQEVLQENYNTVLDMWHGDPHPLLVVQEEPEILQYWKPGNRLVIIINKGQYERVYSHTKHITGSCTEHHSTYSISQLNSETQNKILDKQVNFQGQFTNLKAFIKHDSQLLQEISGESLLCILKSVDGVKVGKPLSNTERIRIPRNLYRLVHVSTSIFQAKSSDIFVVSSSSPEDMTKLISPHQLSTIFKDNCDKTMLSGCRFIFVEENSAVNDFDVICSVVQHRNLHLLHLRNNSLQWIKSTGKIETLYPFIENKKSLYTNDTEIPGRIVLVVAKPGMGKTTLLERVEYKTHKKYKTKWVLRFSLNLCCNELSKLHPDDQESVFQFLKSVAIGENGNPFEIMLLNYCLTKTGNIAILVDGFDEIHPNYTEAGLKLLSAIQETKVEKIWVTSRTKTQELLEKALCSLPFCISPLNEVDQKNYMTALWKKKTGKDAHLNQLAGDILSLVKKSLGHLGDKLMGIPLLTMMLAESFQDIAGECCSSEDRSAIQLPAHLDLTDLYDRFIEKKYEIAVTEKYGAENTRSNFQFMYKDLRKAFSKKHQVLALITVLPPEKLTELNNPKVIEKAEELVQHEDEIENIGIIVKIEQGIPLFIHRTFAEFFASSWFAESHFKIAAFLENNLFDANFDIIRKMFDGILARNLELHKAVLNYDLKKFDDLLKNGESSNRVDLGGRTALHLASSCKEIHSHEISFVIQRLIENGAQVNLIDNIFQWTPIQYAEHVEAWLSVEMLLQAGSDSENLQCIKSKVQDLHYIGSLLAVCCKNGYLELLKFLVQKGADVNMVVANNNNTPLHLASMHGHTHIVKYLIESGANIRALNVDESTPLHVAAGWGHLPTVQHLVKAGSEMNKSDIGGSTPLDVADRWGFADIVEWLIEAGANTNSLKYSPSTEFHRAAKEGRMTTIMEMVRNGVDVNILDESNNTALHVAAKAGHGFIAQYLVDVGSKVNAVNKENCTPLFLAASWNYYDIVSILIKAGSDIHLANKENRTAFLEASRWGHTPVLKLLLDAGADCNQTDPEGYVALHWAAMRNYTNSAHLLLLHGADVNIRDPKGKTPLHMAATDGYLELVDLLVQKGADINLMDNVGSTALSLATISGHKNVENFLRSADTSAT